MGADAQHPIAGEAASHAHRVHPQGDEKKDVQSPRDMTRHLCEQCMSSSFSDTDGLRLLELKDKLSKLAKITTDPDLKSRVTELSQRTERLDAWQQRSWTEIQNCLQTVFNPNHQHRMHMGQEDRVTLSSMPVMQTQAVPTTKRVEKPESANTDASMAEHKDKDEGASLSAWMRRIFRGR